jgi:hypothetical protein
MEPVMKSLCCLVLLASTGCASIVSETRQTISFGSEPEGADVVVKDENGETVFRSRTPASTSLAKGDGYFDGMDYTCEFSRAGYETRTETLQSSMNGWYWGNFLFGGLIGFLAVDPATGAMWKYAPPRVDVTLVPDTATTASAEPSP